jgi:hypothetical protein
MAASVQNEVSGFPQDFDNGRISTMGKVQYASRSYDFKLQVTGFRTN